MQKRTNEPPRRLEEEALNPQPAAPAVKESLTVAEPVKAVDKSPVPSNEDIAAIWNAVHGFYGGAPFRMNHADFARALLAKYGATE